MSRYEHLIGRACHFLKPLPPDFDEDLDFEDLVIGSTLIGCPGFKLERFNNLVVAELLFRPEGGCQGGRDPTAQATSKHFPQPGKVGIYKAPLWKSTSVEPHFADRCIVAMRLLT